MGDTGALSSAAPSGQAACAAPNPAPTPKTHPNPSPGPSRAEPGPLESLTQAQDLERALRQRPLLLAAGALLAARLLHGQRLADKGGHEPPAAGGGCEGGRGGARKGRGGSAAAVGVAEARGISSNPGWQDSVLQGAARIGHNLERPLPSCQELDPRPTHAAPPTGQPASPACKPASVYQPAASQPRKQASSGGTRLPGRRPPCAAR
jgi:hypothetical protein